MSDNQQSPVTQADKQLTAEILGCRDWSEATDYRNSGEHDRNRGRILALVARHRFTTTDPDVGRLREALDKRTSMSTISAPNARVHVEIRFACLSEAHGLVDAIMNRPTLEPRTAGEAEAARKAKGAPISDWRWWVGSDETVSEDGLYDLYEAGTRDDAIGWAECHVGEGEIFHIIEARTRALQADDEFMPFVDRRNAMTFKVNSEGVAVEVAANG